MSDTTTPGDPGAELRDAELTAWLKPHIGRAVHEAPEWALEALTRTEADAAVERMAQAATAALRTFQLGLMLERSRSIMAVVAEEIEQRRPSDPLKFAQPTDGGGSET